MSRCKPLILTLSLLIFVCNSFSAESWGALDGNGTFSTEDAVFTDAALGRSRREPQVTRDAKQLTLLRLVEPQDLYSQACRNALGKEGTCKNFRDCYPLFKVVDISGYPAWIMGQYDTCSYLSNSNVRVFGVCCTEPVGTPPQQQSDVQRFGLLRPTLLSSNGIPLTGISSGLIPSVVPNQWVYDVNQKQIPAQWPPTIPPLPTHPPDHTAPTHPPSLVAGNPTTRPPYDEPVTQTTTWGTKPPASTTKQTWPPTYPTQPSKPPVAPGTDSSCGIKNGPQTYGSTQEIQDEERIVGGHNAELNEWPWITALFNNGRQFCGGSLIDDRHILTAAHCVAHMTSWDVARLTARLGDYNIRTNTETQHIERKIKRVVRHRNFDMRTLYSDVAVLTLDRPVTFTENIRPVCLPGGSRAYAGQIGTVIGWGSLRESGPQPSVLQEVSIPIWTNSECRLKYGSAAPGGIVEHMLCAGKASMDSCSGDSGGPLMVNDGGRWTQVGVVSWGIGCGKGQYPGVYTRVTSFLPWIQKNAQ